MPTTSPRRLASVLVSLLSLVAPQMVSSQSATYDVVIANGRVMDPESGLDAPRNIGVSAGTIRAISASKLTGKRTIDATGMVVSPGFIDLHQHGQDDESNRLKVRDGVTSSFELEVGTDDVDRWYADHAGKSLLNYGVSIGHIAVRMHVMHDAGGLLPNGPAKDNVATPAEREAIRQGIRRGLARGAVAVGMGISYTLAASPDEIVDVFREAKGTHASVHVHAGRGGLEKWRELTFEEPFAAAQLTGVPLHMVHVNSVAVEAMPQFLRMIAEARSRHLDVTTELYPYTASQTSIQSALYDVYENVDDSVYARLLWPATGERLTRETFHKYRKTGGMVVNFMMSEDMIRLALRDSIPMIASDGGITNGVGHPRVAGTFSRVLGRYVREEKTLGLMDALRKMTLMPAERLAPRVAEMKQRGRLKVGAIADIVVIDAAHVIDRATYEKPGTPSEGIPFVLVNGVPVVSDGKVVEGVLPGRPVRAPLK